MARFKINSGGHVRLYDILDDALTVGSAADCALRLEGDDVAPVHVRVWRAEDGVWLNVVDVEAVEVNGHRVSRHRLRHGDRVTIGAQCALEFVDPEAARAPAPPRAAERSNKPAAVPRKDGGALPAGRSPGHAKASAPAANPAKIVVPSAAREARDRGRARGEREERRRARETSATPRWHLFTGLLLLSAAVVFIVVRVLGGSVGVQSAVDLIALAESQLERGNAQQALQTAQTAAARAKGDAALEQRIAAIEAKIKRAAQAAVDAPLLEGARQGVENLRVFAREYLAAQPSPRPASRELVRLVDAWQQRYASVVARHADLAPLAQEAAALRQRFVDAAQLDQPDGVDDVMFAARRLTRLRRPRYREALALLDKFTASGAAGADRARDYRAELAQTGRAWFDRWLAQLERECERGRIDTVLAEAEAMLGENVAEEWRAELESAVQRWRRATGR